MPRAMFYFIQLEKLMFYANFKNRLTFNMWELRYNFRAQVVAVGNYSPVVVRKNLYRSVD